MKSIEIKCPLCKGTGKHKIYWLPSKNQELRKLVKELSKNGLTQAQIGRELGISRQRVWQILTEE